MSQFSIEINGSTVDIELTFHSLTSNIWRVIGGDSSILPSQSGTWSSSGLTNVVSFQGEDAEEFMVFLDINVATISTDRFKYLSIGDSGPILATTVDMGPIWTYTSP
jgi:hypothetical protein